jgi:hypothetical protein
MTLTIQKTKMARKENEATKTTTKKWREGMADLFQPNHSRSSRSWRSSNSRMLKSLRSKQRKLESR